MMEKCKPYRKIIICACAAVAVIAAAAVILLSNKEESYRSIMVYDVEGSAVIERASVGTMDAAENLYLESGDRVSVAADSGMRMKLDNDKYVMAEANTVFSVEAEGTDADSRTKICLEQGAITNEIQNPLSEGSQFETSTPNSVMAVRGTIYRVELYVDEYSDNEDKLTKLSCFQGQVGTKPILADRSFGEEVLVPAGSELIVYQDGSVSEIRDIAYDELPLQAVVNLLGMMENGQEITGITMEELTRHTLETEDVSEAAESENTQAGLPETVQTTQDAERDAAAKPDTDTQIHTGEEIAKSGTGKETVAQPKEKEQQPAAPQQPAPEKKTSKPAPPKNNGSTGNGNSGGDDARSDRPDSDEGGDEPKQDKPEKPDKPVQPPKPKVYKVTFLYQGKVFATQNVKSGKTASAPVLVPEAGGAWDYDFDEKIKADTTITWKSGQ